MMNSTGEILHGPEAMFLGDPDKPVSRRSKWSDLTWYLDTMDPGYTANGIAVRWWPGREAGVRPSSMELSIIDDMKRFAWISLFRPELGFVKKVTGLPILAHSCAALLRFMSEYSLPDFASLTPATAIEFVRWTASDIRRPADAQSDGGAIKKTSFQRLLPLVYIWKARRYLESAGVAVPAIDPLEGQSALKVARHICDWVVSALPAVPEEAFVRIVNAAADIVLVHSKDVLAAQNIWIERTGGFGLSLIHI